MRAIIVQYPPGRSFEIPEEIRPSIFYSSTKKLAGQHQILAEIEGRILIHGFPFDKIGNSNLISILLGQPREYLKIQIIERVSFFPDD